MGLVFAMVSGPFVLFDSYLLPAFWVGYRPARFSNWIRRHHKTSLWSQLFFSLAITLACFVRIYQISGAIYESEVITQIVMITLVNLSLSLSAVYQRVEHMAVCLFLFLVVFFLTVAVEVSLDLAIKRYNGLLQACLDVSTVQGFLGRTEAMLPYYDGEVTYILVLYFVMIFAVGCIWCYLWLRQEFWILHLSVSSCRKFLSPC